MSDRELDRRGNLGPVAANEVFAVVDAIRDGSVPRRERIATAIMAAFFTHNSVQPLMDLEQTARVSAEAADALIAELDR